MAYAIGGNTSSTYPGLMPGSYSDIFSTQTLDLANFGQNWVKNTNLPSFYSSYTFTYKISMSASGQYQTVVSTSFGYGQYDGYIIYISSDYGSTWTSNTINIDNNPQTSKFWSSVSVSASGKYQTAVASDEYIYISSDYGNNWTSAASSQLVWNSVSISASGQYQTACVYSGSIWISSDYGSNWTEITSTYGYNWNEVSISASGQYQTACVYSGSIWTSSDYGNNWTEIITTSAYNWKSVSISASGQYQTACINGGYTYISSDYGNTWEVTTVSNSSVCAVSASGQYQVVCENDNAYCSNDYGKTWVTNTLQPDGNINGVAISASGQYITTCPYGTGFGGGYMYNCQNSISAGVVSVGNYSSEPSGTTGSIYYDTSSAALKVYDGSTWSSLATGYGILGVTALGYTGLTGGATLTSDKYIQMAYAIGGGSSNTYPGLMPGSYSDIFSTQTLDLANFGQNWVQNTNAGSNNWTFTAVSASGQYQTTVVYGGSIWVSSNYGSTWTTVATGLAWSSVSISASGQYQTAVVYGGLIWISSNYGLEWTSTNNDFSADWDTVQMSASGQYQTAVVYGGSIWISSNYGFEWSELLVTSGQNWSSLAVSATGQYQTATQYDGGLIYTSTNYGSTWTQVSEINNNNWLYVSMSASGQYQTAVWGEYSSSASTGSIYVSSNYGNNWTEITSTQNYSWQSVSVSVSGQYQTACVWGGSLYVSINYGSTWSEVTNTSGQNWIDVSISASGQYQTACVDGGLIYTCQNSIANGVVSVGNYSSTSGVTGSIGSIYYDTTDSVLKYSNGTSWSSIGSGSSLAGVTAVTSSEFANGATLTTDNYLQLGPASATNPGILTTGSQTIAGSKTFSSNITVNDVVVGKASGGLLNVVVGQSVLLNNTSGNENTAFGAFPLYANTTGGYNVALGNAAMASNTTGSYNTVVGLSSLATNTTGSYNTALGVQSLNTNVGGTYNVGIGYYANVGSANLYNVVAIGASAIGYTSNTIQMGNSDITQMNTYGTIGVGRYSNDNAASGITGSIYYNTSDLALKVFNGTSWSSIGSGSGIAGVTAVGVTASNGATLTTDSYLQLVAAGATYPGIVTTTGQTFAGSKTFTDTITGTTGTFSKTVTAAAFNSTSDYRVKENIQDLNLNIYNVNPLRPVNYYNNRLNKLDIGFIAHEVQQYYPFLVSGEKDGDETQSLNYNGLIGILVKEIQELKERVKQLEDNTK